MRHISVSTCFDTSIPIERQLPMIRQAGFEFVSLSFDYKHNGILDKNRLSCLKDILSDTGLSVDTVHGYDMDRPDAIEVNRKLVNAAAELHAPVVVLHCSAFDFDPAELIGRRKDMSEKLQEFEKMARESGIRFAFENVLPGTATDFMEETLNIANPRYFGFCFDSSHDQIGGPRPFDLLERNSGRLTAVHISDRIKEFVDHVIPGEGFIDFDSLCSLLRQASIGFPLLLEVMTLHSGYKAPVEFLSAAYLEAALLYDRIY